MVVGEVVATAAEAGAVVAAAVDTEVEVGEVGWDWDYTVGSSALDPLSPAVVGEGVAELGSTRLQLPNPALALCHGILLEHRRVRILLPTSAPDVLRKTELHQRTIKSI